MSVTITWNNPAVDLDLYLTDTSCNGYPPISCTILAASQLNSGTFEQVSLTVQAGQQFLAFVDNFTDQAQTYTLSLGFQGFTTTGGGSRITLSEAEVRGQTKPSGQSKMR